MAFLYVACLTGLALLGGWFVVGFLLDFQRKRRCMNCLPPPMQAPHWFWGHLIYFKPDEESLVRVNNYVHSNGYKCVGGWLGPIFATISTCHPDTVKVALKEPKLRNVYHLLTPWLGDGLLTIRDGPKWHRNRRLLTPAFHYGILKGYVSIYNDCLQHLFEKWDTSLDRNEPVIVFKTVSSMSLDILLQCAFSFKSNCQREANQPAYIRGVYQLVECMADRFFNPFYQIDWIYSLTPSGRRMKLACNIVHRHAELVIKERKHTLGLDEGKERCEMESKKLLEQITNSRRLDFLDILLTAVDDEGVGLTDIEIRNEVDTFMFEGHDTTTSGISWTLYCLAKYPEHQVKVREEVRRVLGGRKWLNYDDLKELKYTQWCIKEAMRLYPPVFLIFRQSSREIEMEGCKIPKGVWLSVIIHQLHRNPNVWPEPDKYDPLRFEPSNAKNRDPYAYLAFSAGSRNCIGQNFAINELRVVVASIVNRYQLSVVKDHAVEMLPLVVMRAKHDLKLRLEPLSE